MMSADIDDRLASSKRRAALGCLAVAVVASGVHFAVWTFELEGLPVTVGVFVAILAAFAAITIAAATMVGRGPRLVALAAIAVAVAPAVVLVAAAFAQPNALGD
jgi:hypothetical protein